VYFDIDEQSVQEIQQLKRQGESLGLVGSQTKVMVGLAKDRGNYPFEGNELYAEPELDASTGSRTYRAKVSKGDASWLMPGNFIRVQISKGKPPYPGPVVPERAFGSEQGNKYLLVMDDQKKVSKRYVKPGPAVGNGLRVIQPPDDDGKKAKKLDNRAWTDQWVKQWVVLDGLQEAESSRDPVVVQEYLQLALETGDTKVLKKGNGGAKG
jgi:multidrug efflux pump subunit AcrA (membrane-fusion protein)